MAEQALMKDGLGPAAISRMARALDQLGQAVDTARFSERALDKLETLELKERVGHLIGALHAVLPAEFPEAARLLEQLPAGFPAGDMDDPLRGFAAWPFIDYVAEHGLQHPERALDTLRRLTGLFSAEFAIRPFLIDHFEVAYKRLQSWVNDPDPAVRRLVSEGTRPRLPWGQRLPAFIRDPGPVFKLLEQLRDDPSETVRRSVANNLNDIAKDHPDRVIETCRRWSVGASARRQWIIRHATRSLVKSGHPGVFVLLGYTDNPRIAVNSFRLDAGAIKLGERIVLAAELQSRSKKPQRFVVDYAVHHVKANGRTTAKVFKLRSQELAAGAIVSLKKSHTIRPITTRRYYPGTHAIELLINGQPVARAEFDLQVED